MEVQAHHYLAKNEAGDILFKIELAQIEGFPWLMFSCSLDIDFQKHKRLQNSIKQLCATDTTPEAKAKLVQDIIQRIQRIEGVDQLYFKNRKRDEEPRVRNGIAEFLVYIFEQSDFEQYVPFSETQNLYFFRELKNKLAEAFTVKDMIEVERSCYESLIKGHKRLEDEYVNHFTPTATFYGISIWYSNVCYEFYLMKTNRIVLIFFMEML